MHLNVDGVYDHPSIAPPIPDLGLLSKLWKVCIVSPGKLLVVCFTIILGGLLFSFLQLYFVRDVTCILMRIT